MQAKQQAHLAQLMQSSCKQYICVGSWFGLQKCPLQRAKDENSKQWYNLIALVAIGKNQSKRSD